MKIAIIGNLDTIKGFKLLGIDVFGVRSKEEAKKVLFSVCSNNVYAVLFLTENWLAELKEEIKQFEENFLPAIMTIPNIGSKKLTAGESELSRIIERAIGSDILSK